MPIFDTCGCCSIRHGVIMLATCLMLISLCLTAISSYFLFVPNLEGVLETLWRKLYLYNGGSLELTSNSTSGYKPLDMSNGTMLKVELFLVSTSVVLVACVLSNALLIIGAVKKITALMVQWMIMQWICVLIVIAAIGLALWKLILHEATLKFWWMLLCGFVVFILLFVALLVVLSLYQSLRDREQPDYSDDVELLNRSLWIPKVSYYSS